jgi:hypothetical protein
VAVLIGPALDITAHRQRLRSLLNAEGILPLAIQKAGSGPGSSFSEPGADHP